MAVGDTSWLTPGQPARAPGDDVELLAAELGEEDRKLVDWMAEQVVSRRLASPALFMLESWKPMNFVSSQFLLVLSPLLGAFLPRVPYDRLVALLEKRPFIELVQRKVEALEDLRLTELKARKAKNKQAQADSQESKDPQ